MDAAISLQKLLDDLENRAASERKALIGVLVGDLMDQEKRAVAERKVLVGDLMAEVIKHKPRAHACAAQCMHARRGHARRRQMCVVSGTYVAQCT